VWDSSFSETGSDFLASASRRVIIRSMTWMASLLGATGGATSLRCGASDAGGLWGFLGVAAVGSLILPLSSGKMRFYCMETAVGTNPITGDIHL
jgi:hypothetical protein